MLDAFRYEISKSEPETLLQSRYPLVPVNLNATKLFPGDSNARNKQIPCPSLVRNVRKKSRSSMHLLFGEQFDSARQCQVLLRSVRENL